MATLRGVQALEFDGRFDDDDVMKLATGSLDFKDVIGKTLKLELKMTPTPDFREFLDQHSRSLEFDHRDDVTAVRAFLEQVRYKPFTWFRLEDTTPWQSRPMVVLHGHVPNSTKPGYVPCEVVACSIADPWLLAARCGELEKLQHLLRDLVYQFEHHEIDEWLRFEGELLNDPHATTVPRS